MEFHTGVNPNMEFYTDGVNSMMEFYTEINSIILFHTGANSILDLFQVRLLVRSLGLIREFRDVDEEPL